MNLFTALRLHNLTAPSALDVVCSAETMREIIDAMTPGQLYVATCLADGMTPAEIAVAELQADGMTPAQIAMELKGQISRICGRRKTARERIAGMMYHCNAEHLHGDVLSRRWKSQKTQDYHKDRGACVDCGKVIHARSTRCNSCAQLARYRKGREESAVSLSPPRPNWRSCASTR